jgi:3-phenylpropionate/trans-cinnamate dioxygenase ferredoxin subunit
MDSNAIPLGLADSFAIGETRLYTVNGREIGVFRTPKGFAALRNTCPHRGAPLCRGEVTGTFAPSRPGEYRWERDGEILRCPWHAWEFDLHTGAALHVPGQRVKTYRVEVRGGELVLYA